MHLPRAILMALLAILCMLNLVVTLTRSTIPLRLEGRLERIEFLTEDNPGIDDIYVLHIGDDDVHVDRGVAKQLTAGVYVAKDAWSNDLTVGRFQAARTVELSPSEDFAGMLVVMPVVAVVVAVLLFARPRSAREEARPPA